MNNIYGHVHMKVASHWTFEKELNTLKMELS